MTYDVVVAGGGPAGCAAAIAAGRMGMTVLLVEASFTLGGMATIGLVPAWCPFSDGEKIIYRGIAQEIFELSREGVPFAPPEQVDWLPINAEYLKRVLDRLVTSCGVELLLGTTVCGASRDGDRLVSVTGANKSGVFEIRGKIFIDATGDGDIAYHGGVPYSKGDEDGALQPATLCFILSNVNIEEYQKGGKLHGSNPNSPIYKIMASEKYPLITDAHLCSNVVGKGTLGFNAGHIWNSDNTNASEVTKSMMLGREIAEQFRMGLAEFAPAAFGHAHLAATAPTLGSRESRRIEGEYTLTLDDYLARRSFDDEIARNAYYIDVHRIMTSGKEIEKDTYRYGKGESHGIPLRCLMPKGVDNLLIAGRIISADRVVMGSVRVMPNCLTTGEASGVTAALAVASKSIRSVNPATVRAKLLENGAYLK